MNKQLHSCRILEVWWHFLQNWNSHTNSLNRNQLKLYMFQVDAFHREGFLCLKKKNHVSECVFVLLFPSVLCLSLSLPACLSVRLSKTLLPGFAALEMVQRKWRHAKKKAGEREGEWDKKKKKKQSSREMNILYQREGEKKVKKKERKKKDSEGMNRRGRLGGKREREGEGGRWWSQSMPVRKGGKKGEGGPIDFFFPPVSLACDWSRPPCCPAHCSLLLFLLLLSITMRGEEHRAPCTSPAASPSLCEIPDYTHTLTVSAMHSNQCI